MNRIRDQVSALPRRAWWILLGAVAITAVLIFVARRGSGEAAPGTAGKQGSGEAMQGMNMSSNGSVKLTPVQLAQFGVTFGYVALRPLSTEVRTVGTVTVDETRVAKVTSKFSGYIERLNGNFVGQAVRRGESLGDVFSPDLLAAVRACLMSGGPPPAVGCSACSGAPPPGDRVGGRASGRVCRPGTGPSAKLDRQSHVRAVVGRREE